MKKTLGEIDKQLQAKYNGNERKPEALAFLVSTTLIVIIREKF